MNNLNRTPIYIPLLNPNERDAQLVTLNVEDGNFVEDGFVICILETTKSTAEVSAESSGYIIGLKVVEGQTVSAGDILCYLTDSLEETPVRASLSKGKSRFENNEEISSNPEIPTGLRITKPALNMANQYNLQLNQLPIGPLITKELVQNMLNEASDQNEYKLGEGDFNPTSIIIYGGGGHGKTLIELIQAMGIYQVVGIVDDGLDKGTSIFNIPVLGGKDILPTLYSSGVHLSVNAVGGVGDNSTRLEVFQILDKAGFVCPPVMHPTAYKETSAILSPGVQVFSHAYIGSEAKVGFGVIINTGAIISHGCTIGDNVHISPGAILAGDVNIGNGVLVGMGVTVNLGVKIADGAQIGNGATVKQDVPENSIIKAGTIWPQ
jgi:sugar O-acyltransferase (sialic acid O-acetyltransferase NeuD family)